MEVLYVPAVVEVEVVDAVEVVEEKEVVMEVVVDAIWGCRWSSWRRTVWALEPRGEWRARPLRLDLGSTSEHRPACVSACGSEMIRQLSFHTLFSTPRVCKPASQQLGDRS